MLQSIKKIRETKLSQEVITVMFHRRRFVSGGDGPFRARVGSVQSPSGLLAVYFFFYSSVPSQVGLVNEMSYSHQARHRSLSRTEVLFAEGPTASSASVVFAANPNPLSESAAASSKTTLSDRRRRASA